tara:strand:- start:372 stop:998 length:627 start_codon:yes stop_codon:yes gene_type:complete
LNLNKLSLTSGFSLPELMASMSISAIMFLGFMVLGGGVSNELSYEDVYETVERYGNYVLDDISESFRQSDVDYIELDNAFETTIVRVKFSSDRNPIKYNIQELEQPLLAGNVATNIRNKRILKDNAPIDPFLNYTNFENKGYAVTISEFRCSPYSYQGKYGGAASNNLSGSVYIIDMQIEIHEVSGNQLALCNTIDFQKTIFVTDEFI